jgi:hypothetical protein
VKEIYRQAIDINKYDFSTAQAHLVASINGRFSGDKVNRYGQNRLGKLSKKTPSDKVITYQTSSVGKLNPKFLTSLK